MDEKNMSRRYLYRKHESDLSSEDRKDVTSNHDEEDDENSIIAKSVYSDEEFPSSDRDSVDLNVLERGSSAEQLENSIHQAIKRTIKRFSNSSIKEEANYETEEDPTDRDTEDASDYEKAKLNGYSRKRRLIADSSDEELEKNKENIGNARPGVSSVAGRSSKKSSTPLLHKLQRKRRIIHRPDTSDDETPLKKMKSELTNYSTSPEYPPRRVINLKDKEVDIKYSSPSFSSSEYAPRRVMNPKDKKPDIKYSIKSKDDNSEKPGHYISKPGSSKDLPSKSEDKKIGFLRKTAKIKSKSDDSSDDFKNDKIRFPIKTIKVERKSDDSSDDSENDDKKIAKKVVKVERKSDDSSDDSENKRKEFTNKFAKVYSKSDDSDNDKKKIAKKAIKVERKFDDTSDDSEDEKNDFPKLAARVKSNYDDSSDEDMDNSTGQSEMSVSYMRGADSDCCEDTSTSSEVSVTSEDDCKDSDYLPDDYENRKNHLINQKQHIERKLVTTKILLKTANADSNFDEARRYQQTIDAEQKKLTEISENLENIDNERLWNQLYYTAPKKTTPKSGNLFKGNSFEMDPAYLTPKLEDGNKKLGKQAQATLNREQSLTVERLQDLHGSLVARPVENQKAKDPEGLKVVLMPHQQHALAWLQWRETQNPRGGVLADEMGLGKTLTMIALVMASITKDNDGEASEDEDSWKSSARGQRHLGGTLVVVPASLLSQWEGEVKTHCKRNSIKVEVYHGAKRETAPSRLAKNDIVLTTYNIVCREYKMCSLLFKIRWRRVILDEAHVIRNHKSQPCESVCALHTNKRWAVTGTPLHNKEMDLYSLLKFLQCSPFDDVRVWKRWVDNKNDAGHVRLATVMKTLMLRRTKQELQEKGELPPLPQKTVKIIEVALDHEERLVYDKVMLYSRTLFDQFLTQRAEKAARAFEFGGGGGYERLAWNYRGRRRMFTKKQNKLLSLHADVQAHEILVLLIRLRQVCCHPSLIGAMLDRDDIELQAGTDLFPEVNKSNNQKKIDDAVKDEIYDDDELDFEVDERVAEPLLTSENPVFSPNRQSSKMRAVISRIEEVLDKNDKIIVVSQWVGVLNIVAKELDLISGASYRMFTGQVAVKDRQGILDDFNSKRKNPNILLLSLNAGGVGLNVVGANHMLLIDIHWNPQLESQAQDRIHRFGQTKDVTIYKYICSDTIEERIQALQNKKLELARQILTGTGKIVGSKLSLDDIKSLFGV